MESETSSNVNVTKRRGPQLRVTRSNRNAEILESSVVDSPLPQTPTRNTLAKELPSTPSTNSVKLISEQTPRRSVRKSIKPAQDYEEIVCGHRLRSAQHTSGDEENNADVNAQPKWTPAKVGRVSQKRSHKKSGRKTKTNKKSGSIEEENNIDTQDSDNLPSEVIEKAANINDTPPKVDKNKKEISNSILKSTVVDLKEDNPNKLNTTFEQIIENDLNVEGHIEGILNTNKPPVEVDSKMDENTQKILNTTFEQAVEGDSKIEESTQKVLNTTFEATIEVDLKMEENTQKVLNTTFEAAIEVDSKKEEKIQKVLNTTFEEKNTESFPEAGEKEDIKMKREISIKTGELNLAEMGVTPISYDNEECIEDNERKVQEQQETSILNEAKKKETKEGGSEEKRQTINLDDSLGCTPLNSSKIDEIEIYESDKMEKQPQNEGRDLLSGAATEETSLDSIPITADDDEDIVFVSIENPTVPDIMFNTVSQIEEDDEEMPSLIFCDDDDDDEAAGNDDKVVTENEKSHDDTFNTSDCMIVSPLEENCANKFKLENPQPVQSPALLEAVTKVKKLQVNYFSPVKKPVTKVIPKIVLSNEDNSKVATLIRTPRKVNQVLDAKNSSSIKKKSTSKGYRFPTPFKAKKDFDFGKKDNENSDMDSLLTQETALPIITTLEPKDIVLRSIRKRSMSVTIEGDLRKRKALNVTFHSPANQTTTIADMDNMIAKSAAKNKNVKKLCVSQDRPPRKRSLSVDDRFLNQPSKIPRRLNSPAKLHITPQKPTTSRVKIPNFAAIHEKQFQKMENLVDYVARKAERAQNLTNSALKTRNAAMPPKSPLAKTTKPAVAKPLPFVSAKENDASNRLKDRRQRHMEMFKSRSVEPKRVTQKNNEIIRGVRSNRRFELMMQHRKTSGN